MIHKLYNLSYVCIYHMLYMKPFFTGAVEAYEFFEGRLPYKTMIKEEIKIHPAPIEDKIYIPWSFSMIGFRPRLPRVVKIVMHEIAA